MHTTGALLVWHEVRYGHVFFS